MIKSRKHLPLPYIQYIPRFTNFITYNFQHHHFQVKFYVLLSKRKGFNLLKNLIDKIELITSWNELDDNIEFLVKKSAGLV